MSKHLPELIENPGQLARYLPVLRESQLRALMEVITGAGIDYRKHRFAARGGLNNHRDRQGFFALARQTYFHRKDPFRPAAASRASRPSRPRPTSTRRTVGDPGQLLRCDDGEIRRLPICLIYA